MSGFSVEQIKILREETGAGMMDVKNALTEAAGDMAKAKEILRQKGAATAEKKSSRVTAEGVVKAYLLSNLKAGALAEVNCETDFSAKNERFQALVDTVVQQVAEKAPATMADLLAQPSVKDPSATIENVLTDTIGAVKENMTIRRFIRYEVDGEGMLHSYIHGGGKIGILVDFRFANGATGSKPEVQQLVKDVAMHIAASAPEFVSRAEVPQSVVDEETRIEMGKEDVQKKPEDIRAKIVEGRVNKIVGARVLLEQPFVKDPNKTIEALVEEVSKQVGDTITIKRFTRYLLGDGAEQNQAPENEPAACPA